MADAPDTESRHEHGWPEKRRAIAQAAMKVFEREGFARANVATIAAEAEVSKRTLYKHYGDKENLFVSVVEQTLTPLKDRFAEAADRCLGAIEGPDDVQPNLAAFGREWVDTFLLAPDLLALRRLLVAEGTHFPELIDAWRRTGPDLVQNVVENHLRRMDERGLLRVPDAAVAADRLSALILYTANNRALFGVTPIAQKDIDGYVRDGVEAFLGIYGRTD